MNTFKDLLHEETTFGFYVAPPVCAVLMYSVSLLSTWAEVFLAVLVLYLISWVQANFRAYFKLKTTLMEAQTRGEIEASILKNLQIANLIEPVKVGDNLSLALQIDKFLGRANELTHNIKPYIKS